MEEEAKVAICRRLRTRMYYVLGRDHQDLFENSPSAVYWCSLTATALGPDGVYCSPAVCYEARRCFEPEEGDGG